MHSKIGLWMLVGLVAVTTGSAESWTVTLPEGYVLEDYEAPNDTVVENHTAFGRVHVTFSTASGGFVAVKAVKVNETAFVAASNVPGNVTAASYDAELAALLAAIHALPAPANYSGAFGEVLGKQADAAGALLVLRDGQVRQDGLLTGLNASGLERHRQQLQAVQAVDAAPVPLGLWVMLTAVGLGVAWLIVEPRLGKRKVPAQAVNASASQARGDAGDAVQSRPPPRGFE